MLLIYGASGYAGEAIAREAIRSGLPIVVSGRGESIRGLAGELGVDARVLPLSDPGALRIGLSGIDVVLNCAGPFGATAVPLLDACLATGAHYLDLSGEVDEHVAIRRRDDECLRSGVMAMPGVGFGIVPTDCAAVLAARKLAGATHLTIAYETRGGISAGTLRTVLPTLHEPGVHVRGGAFEAALPGRTALRLTTPAGRTVAVVSNPWRADLVASTKSTGIGDIDAYSSFPLVARVLMRIGGNAIGRSLVRAALRSPARGPEAGELAAGGSTVWAIASAKSGAKATVMIEGPDPYVFTTHAAVACAREAMNGHAKPGYQTPASAYGPDFVRGIESVEVFE